MYYEVNGVKAWAGQTNMEWYIWSWFNKSAFKYRKSKRFMLNGKH